MKTDLVFALPGAALPTVTEPFAVLLDADDRFWAYDPALVGSILDLLRAGCRYFVCFGARAEDLHDRIDDLVIDGGYHGTMTTWHDEEDEEDVAGFFKHAAAAQMNAAVVLAGDRDRWMAALSRVEGA